MTEKEAKAKHDREIEGLQNVATEVYRFLALFETKEEKAQAIKDLMADLSRILERVDF